VYHGEETGTVMLKSRQSSACHSKMGLNNREKAHAARGRQTRTESSLHRAREQTEFTGPVGTCRENAFITRARALLPCAPGIWHVKRPGTCAPAPTPFHRRLTAHAQYRHACALLCFQPQARAALAPHTNTDRAAGGRVYRHVTRNRCVVQPRSLFSR
jgi:hypothetical protein